MSSGDIVFNGGRVAIVGEGVVSLGGIVLVSKIVDFLYLW